MEAMFTTEPPPALLIAGMQGLGAEEHALGVHFHDPLPGLQVQVLYGVALVNSGVVHEDVEAPEATHDRVHDPLPVLTAGHVQLEEHRRPTGVDNVGGGPLSQVDQHVGQSDTGALGGEEPGDRGADAPGRTGHERCLTLQSQLRLPRLEGSTSLRLPLRKPARSSVT